MKSLEILAISILMAVCGAMVGAGITLHICANKVQEHTIAIDSVLDSSRKQLVDDTARWHQIVDTWRGRAEKCELTQRNITVILEPRHEELPSLPIFQGAFSIQLGSSKNHPGSEELQPVWVIPAQVPVYTNLPGAQYEWRDGRTGVVLGRFVAMPSPAPAVPQ